MSTKIQHDCFKGCYHKLNILITVKNEITIQNFALNIYHVTIIFHQLHFWDEV